MPQKLDRLRPHCASSAAQDKLVRTSSAIFQSHSKTSAGNVVTEPEHTRGRYMLHSEWEHSISLTESAPKRIWGEGGIDKMNKPQKFQRERVPVLQVTFTVVNTSTNTQHIRRRGCELKLNFLGIFSRLKTCARKQSCFTSSVGLFRDNLLFVFCIVSSLLIWNCKVQKASK